jgi:hypothetical protein
MAKFDKWLVSRQNLRNRVAVFDTVEIVGEKDIETELANVTSIAVLHGLRVKVLQAMKANDGKDFERIQALFIKAQNRLKRVPMKDRK